MPFERYIPGLNARLLSAALLLLGVSCAEGDLPVEDVLGDADSSIMVDAQVFPEEQTRAYIEEGAVNSGTFYLYYETTAATSNSSYSYDWATVDFGHEEGPTTGYAYYMDGDTRKDLKWRHVWDEGKSTQSYYLSNINPDMYTVNSTTTSYWSYFRFNKNDVANPYVAGPLDEVDGTNDILSGSYSNSSMTGKKLSIPMYHRLSLLQINIEVYPSKDNPDFYVNLENAEISISNLPRTVGAFRLTSPTSFSYNTSISTTSSSGISMDRGTVTMVDPGDKDNEAWDAHSWAVAGETPEEGEDGLPAEDKKVYSTKRFVMPPYTITSYTSYWPVLTVKVPRRDVTGAEDAPDNAYLIYSGRIPDIMFNSSNVPEAIALKSGSQLTITATIDSPNPNLIFAPVKVESWVGKGSSTYKIKQAGIYNDSDFKAMLELYRQLQNSEGNKTKNLMDLERYGYLDDNGHLVFQLWASLTLDEDEITGSMQIKGDAPDFSFMFNGYTVSLTRQRTTGGDGGDDGDDGDDDGDSDEPEVTEILAESQGQLKFYGILTGQNIEFKGIKSEDDFWTVMRMFDGSSTPTLTEVMQYGVLNNMDDSIVFDIEATFDLDYDEIWQKMSNLWDYGIEFRIHEGHKVNVKIEVPAPEPDPDTDPDTDPATPEYVIIECEPGSYSPLTNLIPRGNKVGIASPEAFYFLTECYNKYYKLKPDILRSFGTVSGSTWTFYFLNAMTLDGNRAYMSMVPNTAEGRPSYNLLSSTSSYIITIAHDKVPASATCYTSTSSNNYLYPMISGTGQARNSGTTSMSNIISYYNNNSYNNTNYYYLWYYGRFDLEQNKWIFRLYYSSYYLNISYSSLFGKMRPDEPSGKYEYEFELSNTYYFYVSSMPNSAEEGAATSSHYFYQNGRDTYNYPNTAADLRRVADGTYWEYFEEWLEEQKKEQETEP